MITTFCLDCEREIELGPPLVVGQRVTCQYCEVELEIINLKPLEVDWVYNGPALSINLLDDWWGSRPVKNRIE